MKGGCKNWTAAKICLFTNFRLFPKSWGRNFLFLLLVPVTYVLNLYESLVRWMVIKNYRRKCDSLCVCNFLFLVTSLQLCKLSHVSEWLPYLLYILILQWWWYFLGKYCSICMCFFVSTKALFHAELLTWCLMMSENAVDIFNEIPVVYCVKIFEG